MNLIALKEKIDAAEGGDRERQEEDEFFDDDENDYLDPDDDLESCGMTHEGLCMLAGTEWCDWDCPRNK